MSRRTPADTTNWVADNLRKSSHVTKVDVLDDRVLRVEREEYEPFVAGIIAAPAVMSDHIKGLVDSKHDVEIIINVPKESCWYGSALDLAECNNIATGQYGDLLRAIGEEDVRALVAKDRIFVERSLRQHSRVSGFERSYDKVYVLSRNGLSKLTAAMINEYELTADHLRTAWDRYGKFDVAVCTNPNGTITGSALEAAESMGIDVLKWGAFLGRINKG
jgi:hypothetical protein